MFRGPGVSVGKDFHHDDHSKSTEAMRPFEVGDLAALKTTGEFVAIQEVGRVEGLTPPLFCRSILHPERPVERRFAHELILRAAAQG